MSPKRSRVHSTYKTKYRLSNSAEYDQALINRSEVGLQYPEQNVGSRSTQFR